MTVLAYTLGVLAFAIGIIASIALHEVGHMWPAKRFGVKVTQYFVGFGRTVWSVRRGETEYGLKAFPVGGFVKLVGMLPPDPEHADDPSRVRRSNTGLFTQLISDARSTEYEHVGPDDQGRLFYQRPWWQKVIVMAGGPMVNIVLALLMFGIVFMGFGATQPTATVSSVAQCAIPADRDDQECAPSDPQTPAAEAGLRAGDEIVEFDGVAVGGWDELTDLIRANGDEPTSIVYERDGERRETEVTTVVSVRPSFDDPDEFVEAGFLGVSPTLVTERQGPLFVLQTVGDYTVATGEAILALPERMVGVAQAAFGAEREADGPMSVVGAGRVAGEAVTYDQPTWAEASSRVLSLLAAVNLFIALFNLIPLLPLDGGHIAGALYEALRRGWARLRRRPDPGYVDVAKMLPVAYVVGAVLMIMGVLLIYVDIVNPVSLT